MMMELLLDGDMIDMVDSIFCTRVLKMSSNYELRVLVVGMMQWTPASFEL